MGPRGVNGDDAAATKAAPGGRGRKVAMWLIGAAVLVVLAIVVADAVTASPATCVSCHEMRLRAGSWARSPHAQADCVQCHEPPTQWHQVMTRLKGRGERLGHDIAAHIRGDYADPVDSSTQPSSTVTDEACLSCHDMDRETTSGRRILIDHKEHAERNGSCISCHDRVAHPLDTRSDELSLMARCFTCHGLQPGAKAPGRCGLCHPPGYSLKPRSHAEPGWTKRHGLLSERDPALCALCHTKKSCDACHGLAIPHPEGWAKRSGHVDAARSNRAVCERCHTGTFALCSMCHHDDFDPTKGTWVSQHRLSVRDRGTGYCMKCHSPIACIECHILPQ